MRGGSNDFVFKSYKIWRNIRNIRTLLYNQGLTRNITRNLRNITREFPRLRGLERRLPPDRKSTRLNSSHVSESRMPSSA